jgi:hypothetical protein
VAHLSRVFLSITTKAGADALTPSLAAEQMIQLLLGHSADKTLKNKHGVSPMELAATITNFDVRKFFRKPGKDGTFPQFL